MEYTDFIINLHYKEFKMFKEELKKLRLKARYNQKDFAKLLEFPYSTYKNWEQGVSLPNIKNFDILYEYSKSHYRHRELEKAYLEDKAKKQ